MPQTKATKKFEKRHLKDVLKRRKEGKKVKQKKQLDAKRKALRREDRGQDADSADKPNGSSKDDSKTNGAFADMNVDDFFQGGFEIPTLDRKGTGKKKGKSTGSDEQSHTTGKRKRTARDGDEESDRATSSEDSDMAEPVQEDSDAQSESDEDPEAHQEHLKALAEKDPEFYEYLKENDADLLDFDLSAPTLGDLSEESDSEQPRKKAKKDSVVEGATNNEVTVELARKWRKALEDQHSLRGLREVVLAFRSAAHINEDDEQKFKYSISNPDVYHEILVVALSQIPEVLRHHVHVKEHASGKVHVATDSKKFKTLSSVIKSHAISITHLLENLSDAGTLKLTLNSIKSLLPFLLSFKKIVRNLIRVVVQVWSDSANTEATRIAAFLVLRSLTVISDPGIRESVLRTVYQGLVRGSRQTTVHTLPGINLMKNSAAELWGIDPNVGYTTGFTFIRQLAIHLRSSITGSSSNAEGPGKGKDAYKTVYNWQYVHSLDFWSRVLAAHCDASTLPENNSKNPNSKTKEQLQPLHPLIYPTVQITLGAARLIPTAQYFPLRFQLVRSLLRISLATNTYIPLSALLLEVLSSAELRRSPKPNPSTLRPLDFATTIRAPKSYLRTRIYQEGVGAQVVELLSEFFALNAKSIAFPELALPVIFALKRWLKECGSPKPNSKTKGKGKGNVSGKVSSAVNVLVQKLQAHSTWIEQKRARVEFAPDNREQVDMFLKDVDWESSPLGAYVVVQRKIREEAARVLEEGRREEEKRRTEEREAQKHESESEEESAGSEDEIEGSDDEDVDMDGSDEE